MINNELIGFVRKQLQGNIPREQISLGLKANGWNDADISEAFSFVGNNPNTSIATPVHFSDNPNIQINEASNSLTNPNKKTAFGVLILCAFIPALLINIVIALSPLGELISSVLPISGPIVISSTLFVGYILFILVGSFGMKFSAKVFKFENTSFAKAMVNESIVLLIMIAMSVLVLLWESPVVIVVATILNIILFTAFTRWQYNTTILKAIGARILSRIMLIIVAFIFGIIGGILAGVLAGVNRAREKDMQARGLAPQAIVEERNTQESLLAINQEKTETSVTTEISTGDIDSWKLYSYPTEKFSVKFPSDPKITERTENMSKGPLLIKITEASVSGNGEVIKYNVEYIDLPDELFKPTDTKETREAKSAMFYGIMLGLTYGDNATVTPSGGEGQRASYVIKIPGKKLFKGNIIAVNDKVYSYGAECEKCTTIPNINEYLASFSLIK